MNYFCKYSACKVIPKKTQCVYVKKPFLYSQTSIGWHWFIGYTYNCVYDIHNCKYPQLCIGIHNWVYNTNGEYEVLFSQVPNCEWGVDWLTGYIHQNYKRSRIEAYPIGDIHNFGYTQLWIVDIPNCGYPQLWIYPIVDIHNSVYLQLIRLYLHFGSAVKNWVY